MAPPPPPPAHHLHRWGAPNQGGPGAVGPVSIWCSCVERQDRVQTKLLILGNVKSCIPHVLWWFSQSCQLNALCESLQCYACGHVQLLAGDLCRRPR